MTSRPTFEEKETTCFIESEVGEEYYCAQITAEYTVMDVPPDFSADNDQDFRGYKEVIESQFYFRGRPIEEAMEEVKQHSGVDDETWIYDKLEELIDIEEGIIEEKDDE